MRLRSHINVLLLPVTLAVALAVTVPAHAQSDHMNTLKDYFDLLVSGNVESAKYLWTAEALERSQRLGIEYTDIPLKTDCGSPIVRDLNLMRGYLRPPVKTVHDLPDRNFVKLEFANVVKGDMIQHFYYLYFDGEYYWLTYPQDYYGKDWPVTESDFFRIHVDPGAAPYINEACLEQADDWVRGMGRTLQLSKDDMKLLEETKIEYFYCSHDSVVQSITGHLIKGTYDLASGDIISAFFPHHHELVNLLVSFRLRRLPLYTQPLFREGLAVYLGGRWGKAPASLMDLACFLYREELVHLDSLLTMEGFEKNSAADISYPLAGLFSGYLVDAVGLEKYLELYLKMSGKFDEVSAATDAEVRAAIVETTGLADWATVKEAFEAYMGGITGERAVVLPGLAGRDKQILDGDGFIVTGGKEWFACDFVLPKGQSTGNLLFGFDKKLVGQRSIIYDEQYPDETTLDGYRFGIRFDKNEAGLYDYASNLLLAKYIWGITPSDNYWDQKTGRVTISFRKDLADGYKPSKNDFKMLRH